MMDRATFLRLGLLLCAFGATLCAADTRPRASTPEIRKAVIATIEGQLAAFRKADIGKAHGFASSELRAQKPPRVFAAIVQQSYPEIWANLRAEFGIVRDEGKRAMVTVQVYAKDGDAAYDFTLVQEPAGWRIHGVLRHEPKKSGKA